MHKQLPPEFTERLRKELDLNNEQINTFLLPPGKFIRINPRKTFEHNLERIPWTETGFTLPGHPIFMHDTRWLAGRYFVQSSSSMIIETAWKAIVDRSGVPKLVLDLCSAPGGKSTHLLDLMPGHPSFLVAKEVSSKGLLTLSDNLLGWGDHRQIILQERPESLRLDKAFELVVVDAPCSGEGLFSEFPKAIEQWSPDYVETCAIRQEKILKEAVRLVAPGGYLLYSTCTANARENSNMVKYLVESHGLNVVPIPNLPAGLLHVGSADSPLGYQALPHQFPGRAFFFCLLTKSGVQSGIPLRKSSRQFRNAKITSPWCLNGPDETIIEYQGVHHLVPEENAAFVSYLLQTQKVRQIGTPLSSADGKIPHIGLALHPNHSKEIEKIKVDDETAVQYLTGQALGGFGHGWKLIMHQNSILGWIKSIEKRSNNFYPKPWRLPRSVQGSHIRDFSFY